MYQENSKRIKATIKAPNVDRFNGNHRKEDKFTKEVAAFVLGEQGPKEAVIARFYWTASTCYCALWVRGTYNTATGTAGGYGYDKESAALAEAISKAGIDLSENIAGSGQISEPLAAIARAATGKRKVFIHKANA